jgi:hypothetical protein
MVKDDRARSKCQAFQKVQVFGKDRGKNDQIFPPEGAHPYQRERLILGGDT